MHFNCLITFSYNMTGKSVLIIGPGFIGWEVLELLVAEGYQMTGFVRREEHAAGIQKSGAAGVIMGDLDDKTLITEETAKHDVRPDLSWTSEEVKSHADG